MFSGPFSATFGQHWGLYAYGHQDPPAGRYFFAAPLELFCSIFGHQAIVQSIPVDVNSHWL